MIKFKELEILDKPILDNIFNKVYHENSHMCFTNLFMWRKTYNIMWSIENGILYMKASYDGQEFALQPLCDDAAVPQAMEEWQSYFAQSGQPFKMNGVEVGMIDRLRVLYGDKFTAVEDENNFDYVYSSDDLINLAGRKFHSKKNHINSFKKNYPEAEYRPITEEIITQCKININGWYKKHDRSDENIVTERNAIIEILNNFEYLKLKGGAILLDKRVAAFTVGEQLNSDMAVVHVEKADPDVRGAYPLINQQFVQHEFAELTYINREEDMGIPGLRKAKESYRPVKLIRKFNITLSQ